MHKVELQLNPKAVIIDIAEFSASATGVGQALLFQIICEYKYKGSFIVNLIP